jgi:hypothetical protein
MSAPRFPLVPGHKGHYESYYLRAADPAGGRSAWIRHTVFKRPGGPPTGALWCTLFEAGKGPRAVKQSLPDPRPGEWLTIGDSHFGPAGASGRAEALGRAAQWDLTFGPSSAPLRHLPARLYNAPLPRTKLESPLPDTTISGRVEDWELDGWCGMVGHNWGAEHAERWIWLHGTDFGGQPGAWLDATIGRIRVGRWTTPWVANGCLSLDGVRHRLGGLGKTRAVKVEEQPERATFTLPGDGIVVRGEVSAPRADVVGWIYSDPVGPQHHTAHCAIADMTLTVLRPGQPPLALEVRGGATYELGMREHDHGIPIQPFSDP